MEFASFILYALLLLQFSFALEINEKTMENDQDGHPSLDPSLNVFFKVTDLYLGKRMPIYFATDEDSTPTRLLSKKEADSIPFSLSKLPYLLEYFSFSNTSSQAKAMEITLKQCEQKSIVGEVKFCVTSSESMLEMTRGFFGSVKPNVMTTKILSSNHALFQNYTFVEKPLEIYASKKVACHTMAYPYLVYYCHGHEGQMTRVFKLALGGENKERVESVAVCHMDTSAWARDHVAFRILGGHPGSSPVCHVIPVDNLVWFG
ncbi:hypothetical protein L1987_26885 [Smallanthus sonchifolius]|uniref:Uncharacterized protein n=1 Tax=Smallanthus sonchifolius TaxID=185202 RepID=A0ACB9IAE7_9ASTR|nr:hypothetical protein L1987_26885 [Smallanthus sonchifolius]